MMRFFSGKFLIAALLATTPILSQAQPDMAPAKMELTSEQMKLMGELQQAEKDFRQTEQSVQQLEQKAIANSKDLQAKRDALQKIVSKKMNSGGFNAEKESAALKAIMDKYKTEKPSKAVIEDFQKRQMAIRKKQAEVMQEPEVQKNINAFNEAMMAEAKKIDPNTEALLARLKSQMEKIQSIRNEIQKTFVKK